MTESSVVANVAHRHLSGLTQTAETSDFNGAQLTHVPISITKGILIFWAGNVKLTLSMRETSLWLCLTLGLGFSIQDASLGVPSMELSFPLRWEQSGIPWMSPAV